MIRNESNENKMSIMNELYKMNPSFFHCTYTLEKGKDEKMKYLVVLVVLPLGSFSAKMDKHSESLSRCFLDVYERLILLKELVLDELFEGRFY